MQAPEQEALDSPDPWARRELRVKWKRWAHIHCSWDTLDTLAQLGGFKRVQNYMKRADDLAALRRCAHRTHNRSWGH